MHKKKRLLFLVLLAVLFGLGHHVDHIIRGNHVGWPLIPEPTPFTYSLGFYPVIGMGVYLYLCDRVGSGFWALLAGVGFLFVGLLHFGPLAVEPPEDILGPYSSAVAGYAALGWLVAFLLLLAVITVYAARRWWQQRTVTRTDVRS